MGVQKFIESPEKMWKLFQDYKKHVKDNPFLVHDFVGGQGNEVERRKEKPLSIEGFTCYLWDMDVITDPKDYFSNREGRYEAYVPICTRIREAIRQDQIEGGMAGIYNPSITQRLNNLAETTNGKLEVNEIKVTHDR